MTLPASRSTRRSARRAGPARAIAPRPLCRTSTVSTCSTSWVTCGSSSGARGCSSGSPSRADRACARRSRPIAALARRLVRARSSSSRGLGALRPSRRRASSAARCPACPAYLLLLAAIAARPTLAEPPGRSCAGRPAARRPPRSRSRSPPRSSRSAARVAAASARADSRTNVVDVRPGHPHARSTTACSSRAARGRWRRRLDVAAAGRGATVFYRVYRTDAAERERRASAHRTARAECLLRHGAHRDDPRRRATSTSPRRRGDLPRRRRQRTAIDDPRRRRLRRSAARRRGSRRSSSRSSSSASRCARSTFWSASSRSPSSSAAARGG